MQINDADREAAEALRAVLADICGFWHVSGDDGPLTVALARHRIAAERRTADLLCPIKPATASPCEVLELGRPPAVVMAAAGANDVLALRHANG